MTDEELKKILALISEAYTKAGKKISTATMVDEVDEEGNVKGEIVIDNREDEEVN